jgi:hypothetical protein
MQFNVLFVVFAAICMAILPSCASAQQDQPQYILMQDVHLNPGKAIEFEQVRADRNAGMAEANVTFGRTVYAQDGNVFALTIPLSNMAALDEMRAQENAMSAGNPALAREVIHHIDTSIQQRRPELSYTPNTPRVPEAEIGFYRGFVFYLKFGRANDAADIMQQIRALYEENGVENGFTVFSKITGSGPDFSVFFAARDAVDFYTENPRILENIGASLIPLVAQLNALSHRTDNFNSTRREDLDYQPQN